MLLCLGEKCLDPGLVNEVEGPGGCACKEDVEEDTANQLASDFRGIGCLRTFEGRRCW